MFLFDVIVGGGVASVIPAAHVKREKIGVRINNYFSKLWDRHLENKLARNFMRDWNHLNSLKSRVDKGNDNLAFEANRQYDRMCTKYGPRLGGMDTARQQKVVEVLYNRFNRQRDRHDGIWESATVLGALLGAGMVLYSSARFFASAYGQNVNRIVSGIWFVAGVCMATVSLALNGDTGTTPQKLWGKYKEAIRFAEQLKEYHAPHPWWS